MNDICEASCRIKDTLAIRLHLLVIEFHYHAEVLSSLCPALEQKFDVTLFTTKKIRDKIKLDDSTKVNVVLKRDDESLKSFFWRTEDTWRLAHVVYFNTLEENFKFFHSFDFGAPTIIRVHNANATFRPWQSIDLKINPIRLLWHVARKAIAWHYRAKLLVNADCLMMPSEGVKNFCQESGWTSGYKNVTDFCLPFSMPKASFKKTISYDHVTIAVIGTIDPDRKNYQELYFALKEVKLRVSKRIKMRLLGPPKGKRGLEIIELFRHLIDDKFTLFYSTNYIAQAEIDSTMRSVCFLVAPLVTQTRFKIHKEFYGKTKVSGVENDIANFRVPTLLPCGYMLPASTSRGCGFYDGKDELVELLEDWITNGTYEEKEQQLLNAVVADSPMDQFDELCRKLIVSNASL